MADLKSLGFLLAGAGAFYIGLSILRTQTETYKLRHIPTIGPNGFISSYFGRFQFMKHAREMIQEGYDRYRGRAFKVRTPEQWVVVVTSEDMINDIKKASDNYLSFDLAVKDNLQQDYTMGKTTYLHRYHLDLVKTTLTRNISVRFPDVRDEIVAAFTDEIPAQSDWVCYTALSTVMTIVSRTTNRLFVGLPLCRDPDYVNLNIEFTVDVFKSAAIINMFPGILHPLVGPLLSPLSSTMKRAMKHLGTTIQDRLNREDESGSDWDGRPNDLISWLLDENPQGELRSVKEILLRVLQINLAAIHTTSMAFTNILFHVCVQPPEVIAALREEVESVVEEHGWTKVSMGYLRKMDSFMKEVARMVGTSATVIDRKVLKDFTFSDGTTLPTGARVAVPAFNLHRDENNYEDPLQFKPFRFYDLRSGEGESIKHQMITPTTEYFFFGAGKHACPGRFFAVNELKTLLAHTLLTYDVQFEDGRKTVPDPVWFSRDIGPDRDVKVMFRKRRN
ncbi:hypothetical protein VKT23_016137 [Stygiomarasmius scandens]|uniref:Cytochrome P450 n=1 Tax=Marasmiellus scandens TaxID=2682957 RepID=A0ABR1IY54_9AGAR